MDCECGENPGLAPAQHNRFDNDALAGFLTHLPLFRAKRKMSIAWHAEHVQQRSCDTDMMSLVHYANDTTQTLQLGWDNRPSTFNQTLAAFLILRGPSALLAFDVVGPYECASTGCGCDAHSVANQGCDPERPGGKYRLGEWSPLLDTDFGQPLEAPTAEGKLWERRWSKATVSLDCDLYEASIEFNP